MAIDFSEVTELAGTEISAEQLDRMFHRYRWALQYCRDKDVVEVACGSGQGLGLLARVARSLEAGDYSARILALPRQHYGSRIPLGVFDAQTLPYANRSKDVVILFEALYYVPDAERFVRECSRVLRPGGQVLIATANKDLSDFNPSPFTHRYYGAMELWQLFDHAGFDAEIFGYMAVQSVSWRQRVLRPIKKLVVSSGLMPKTMKGKRLLKRLVFGRPVAMPSELEWREGELERAESVPHDRADRTHKVLYCRAVARA